MPMLNLAMKDDYRSRIEKIDRINNDELPKNCQISVNTFLHHNFVPHGS